MIQSKPGVRELVRAFHNLDRQKFETFLPWCWNKRRGKVPLFPYYGFVAAAGRWREINSTYGVLRLLAVDGKPAVIDSGIIDALRRQSDAHGGAVKLRETFKRRWQPDMSVRIIDGPFQGYVGKVLNFSDKEGRVRLLLDVLARPAVVSVSDKDLGQV